MVPGGCKLIPAVGDQWDEAWRLWPLGDIHWGALGCDEERVDETIAAIRDDPRALWIGMGDYIDLISMRDEKRFDPEGVAEQHRSAYFKAYGPQMLKHAKAKFAPIGDKCVGILLGNHEWTYSLKFEQAIAQDLAEALGAPFLGYSCFRDLVFTDGDRAERFRVFAHHGAGWAQTPGGKLNRLLRFMISFDANIYIMGHIHARLDIEIVELGADAECEKLTQKSKAGVVSGTFLQAYTGTKDGSSSYAERKGYSPTPLGAPCIVIKPATRRLSVEKP